MTSWWPKIKAASRSLVISKMLWKNRRTFHIQLPEILFEAQSMSHSSTIIWFIFTSLKVPHQKMGRQEQFECMFVGNFFAEKLIFSSNFETCPKLNISWCYNYNGIIIISNLNKPAKYCHDRWNFAQPNGSCRRWDQRKSSCCQTGRNS